MHDEIGLQTFTLYHASSESICSPTGNAHGQDHINVSKDFGEGFYMSPEKEYPIKLTCMNDVVFLNRYRLDTSGLKTLRLENDLRWLLVTAFHRRDYSNKKKYHPLRDQIRQWVSGYDLVIGTISNDNFYSTMDAFIRNLLTDYVTLHLVQMMNYGEQVVLKSEKACSQIDFLGSEPVDLDVLKEQRMLKTVERNAMEDMVEDRRVRLHAQDNGRLFAQIVEEVEWNDGSWF